MISSRFLLRSFGTLRCLGQGQGHGPIRVAGPVVSARIQKYSQEALNQTGSSSSKGESENEMISPEEMDKLKPDKGLQQPQPTANLQKNLEGDANKDTLYKSIELEVLSYEPSLLDSYEWFIKTTCSHLCIPVGKCWSPLKSDKDRFALLKSAFVHKKHQVHYEVRTYHRFIHLHHLTGSTASTFLEYAERNLPEGCGLKVTKIEAQPLPSYVRKGEESS